MTITTRPATPRTHHFSAPFEGRPHAATWLGWPLTTKEWGSHLDASRKEFAAFVQTVAEVEPVELLLGHEEAEQDARRRLSMRVRNIRMHRVSLDDIWFRDSCPIFLSSQANGGTEVAATVWDFNGWGGKYPYARDCLIGPTICREFLNIRPFQGPLTLEGGALEFDGQGMGMTTTPCLVGPTRNPGMSQEAVQSVLEEYFGVKRWIWLSYGLEGDHTDGHIDTLARFVRPGLTVADCCEPGDSNHQGLLGNRRILREAGLEVIDLPLPQQPRYLDGVRLPETYANYYLASGLVIVPQYGDRNDERALAILRECFPERQVIGLSSRSIIVGGGSFHCLSQQQPAGQLCSSP